MAPNVPSPKTVPLMFGATAANDTFNINASSRLTNQQCARRRGRRRVDVYRTRFDNDVRLTIEADLRRGAVGADVRRDAAAK